jgi:hypothetical protein
VSPALGAILQRKASPERHRCKPAHYVGRAGLIVIIELVREAFHKSRMLRPELPTKGRVPELVALVLSQMDAWVSAAYWGSVRQIAHRCACPRVPRDTVTGCVGLAPADPRRGTRCPSIGHADASGFAGFSKRWNTSAPPWIWNVPT